MSSNKDPLYFWSNYIILFIFRYDLRFEWISQDFSQISRTKWISTTGLEMELLLLYEQELSRIEKAPFRPTFYNKHLTLNLNLTSMATDLFDYFENIKKKIHRLKTTCLQSSKNMNDSPSNL